MCHDCCCMPQKMFSPPGDGMEPTAKHVISFKVFYGEPVSKQYKGKYRNVFVVMQKRNDTNIH